MVCKNSCSRFYSPSHLWVLLTFILYIKLWTTSQRSCGIWTGWKWCPIRVWCPWDWGVHQGGRSGTHPGSIYNGHMFFDHLPPLTLFLLTANRDPPEGYLFLDMKYVHLFQQQSNDSLTPSWCPTMQVNSDTNKPVLAQTLQVKGSVP